MVLLGSATVVDVTFFIALAVWTVLVAWAFVGSRKRLAQQLPYQRRRPVPWGGVEVAVLVGLFLVSPLMVAVVARSFVDLPGNETVEKTDSSSDGQPGAGGTGKAHPVERLLREDHSVWALLVSAIMAVLVAPVVEEFIFRVVFQGWLEKLEMRYRRRMAGLRPLPGAVPVLLSSLFFAAMHIRPPESEMSADTLLFLLGCQAVASLITMVVAILALRLGGGATWSDMGFVPARLRGDVVVGLLTCMAVVGPIYLLFLAVQRVLPDQIVADPIALIPLALALGTLYYRTHRIVPAIVLHMAFNAAGLVALMASAGR